MMIAIEIRPTTPASPSSFTRLTRLSIIFWPRNGDDGPNKSSKIIAITISKSPKSIISRKMFLIFDSIGNYIIK